MFCHIKEAFGEFSKQGNNNRNDGNTGACSPYLASDEAASQVPACRGASICWFASGITMKQAQTSNQQ
jgi:hypothetical protein